MSDDDKKELKSIQMLNMENHLSLEKWLKSKGGQIVKFYMKRFTKRRVVNT